MGVHLESESAMGWGRRRVALLIALNPLDNAKSQLNSRDVSLSQSGHHWGWRAPGKSTKERQSASRLEWLGQRMLSRLQSERLLWSQPPDEVAFFRVISVKMQRFDVMGDFPGNGLIVKQESMPRGRCARKD